ncbi:MAG: hypothetical protein H0W29_16390 [Gemmatimonadales bacterium]|nr:hypothetical protein [Gemmatimonadales bacterium]
MIVSLHVAAGAIAGAAARSRMPAIALGLLAHAAGDRIPHQDIGSRNFELVSGMAGLALLAVGRGPLHPITLGAAACSAPDIEHAVRLPRPGGRKLFPSHRFTGWHRAGGLPAGLQVLVAGLVLGFLARRSPGSRIPESS